MDSQPANPAFPSILLLSPLEGEALSITGILIFQPVFTFLPPYICRNFLTAWIIYMGLFLMIPCFYLTLN